MNHLFEKIVWLLAFCIFIIVSLAVLSIDGFDTKLHNLVELNLEHSGVTHNVTAVLLNFRSLDTMLEVGVVLLALISIYTLSPNFRYRPLSFPSVITDTFVAFLFPIIFLSSIYILLSGTYKSGGAFAASALIAGGVIIIKLIKPHYLSNIKESVLRLIYSFGLFFFVLVGILTMFGGNFLQYPYEYNSIIIVLIEIMLTFSLSAILSAFFIIGVHRFKQ
jgi:multisubunit Na+/H+ antiporter MnhB subunit